MAVDVKPKVAEAVALLKRRYGVAHVHADPDGQGGAFVTVDEVPLGPPFQQSNTWVGFQLTAVFPYADVYPHFTRPDLARLDGTALGEGTSLGTFRDQPALQLSRRSKNVEPSPEMAIRKMLRVLAWLQRR